MDPKNRQPPGEGEERAPLLSELLSMRAGLDEVIGELGESQRTRRVLSAVAECSHVLNIENDFDRALDKCFRILIDVVQIEGLALHRLHWGSEHEAILRPCAAWRRDLGRHPGRELRMAEVGANHWIALLEEGRVARARASEQPEPLRSFMAEDNWRSVLFVPVPIEGKCWGSLAFGSFDDERSWSRVEESLLITVAAGIAGAIDRRERGERELGLQRKLMEARKLESLGQLARGIWHDFNNLLFTLNAHLDLLDRDEKLSSSGREHLEDLQSAMRHAEGFVRQLRQFAGDTQLHREDVCFGDLIDETIRLVRPQLPDGVVVDARVASDIPAMSADPTQLVQVIANLIVNAAEAISPEAGTIHVRAAVRPAVTANPGEKVRLTVQDSGPGMDDEDCARLFEPFFSTKGRGRGLGLAVVDGIVRAHGGSIAVESTPGTGTRFEIELPVGA